MMIDFIDLLLQIISIIFIGTLVLMILINCTELSTWETYPVSNIFSTIIFITWIKIRFQIGIYDILIFLNYSVNICFAIFLSYVILHLIILLIPCGIEFLEIFAMFLRYGVPNIFKATLQIFGLKNLFTKLNNKKVASFDNHENIEDLFQKLLKFKCTICFENFSIIDDGFVTCLPTAENNSVDNDIIINDSNCGLHFICITCLRGYAHSAITDIPVAYGGIGLKCGIPECKNAFLLSSIQSYLDDEDSLPLKQRLQEQCLADAGFGNLVICAACDLKVSISTTEKFYTCICGRKQCTHCSRIYDEKHCGKSCEEMDQNENKKTSDENKLNIKMSEIVIRNCYECGTAFVKEKGCNKMACRCGAKQCYICREKNIDYTHFCDCFDAKEKHGKCERCNKTCRIHEDADELDEIKITQLKEENDSKIKKEKYCVII